MLKRIVILLFAIFSLGAFERVVVWGYPLHTHTHSYIHNAFFRTFKHLGYEVLWLDDRANIQGIDFANSLFLTALGAEKNIPVRDDCQYILHTNWEKDFSALNTKFGSLIERAQCVVLKCFYDGFLDDPDWEKIAPCIFQNVERREIAMPWAADLLPHEIDNEKKRIATIQQKKCIAFIGTIGKGGAGANFAQLQPFFKAGKRKGYAVFTSNPWSKPLPMRKMMQLLQESQLAPAIQGKWQVDVGYIPCRIFKNLSYGCLGITNSYRVWELFDRKIVYDPDSNKLFEKAEEALNEYTLESRYEMMDIIKEKHTYVNRVKMLLNFLEVCGEEVAL